MTEFLHSQGPLALGSRLRAVCDQLYAQGDRAYQEQGIGMRARWFPVLALLDLYGAKTVTEIARAIGFSHPSVISLTRKMAAEGILSDRRDPADERRRLLELSPAGQALLAKAKPVWSAFHQVAANAVQRCGIDILDALHRFEQEITTHPWPEEVAKLMATVEIIDFEPRYRDAFKTLNIEWLQKYFEVEAVDEMVLSDPEQHILSPGGSILFARMGEEIVGTCALKHQGDGVYELTKMGVTADRQGAGIGAALMSAVIEKFRQLDGKELYLETNAVLEPAIKLYARHGFVDQGHRKPGSVYERSDVYMIWSEDT